MMHLGVTALDEFFDRSGNQGPELVKRLKTIRRTPILFMSGYAGGVDAGHASEVAHIQKPFTPDTLARRVLEALGAMDPVGRENSME